MRTTSVSLFLLCTGLALAAAPPQPAPAPVTAAIKPAQPLVHGPDNHGHALRGTIDTVNIVTLEEMAKLGVDSARKRYAGKIVSFHDVVSTGVSAMNGRRKNVCMQGFIKNFDPYIEKFQYGGINVYFNFADEIISWMETRPYNPDDLFVEKPLTLLEDICDTSHVCHEGDPEQDRRCIFSSDRLLLTGKIVTIIAEGKNRIFSVILRPTGIRY